MRTAPVYQVLAEDLKALGVDTVFGLMSDCICQIFSTLDAMGVRMIGARHETNAVMMAMGYAAATGKLGVALVGRGPAMANAMHGTISTAKSGMPVLIISGDSPMPAGAQRAGAGPRGVSGRHRGPGLRDPNLSAEQRRRRSAVAHRCSGGSVAGQDRRAAVADRCAGGLHQRGRWAVTRQTVATAQATGGAPVGHRHRRRPAAPGQTAADRRWVGAHRAGAKQALEALADQTGALLVNALKAKDLFRDNPYNLGILGSSSTSVARRYIEQADCVLAVGVALNSLTMSSGIALPAVPLIHVDSVRTNINRWWPADVGVVGDARLVAEQLAAALPNAAPWTSPGTPSRCAPRLQPSSTPWIFQVAHTARTIDPRILTLELSRMLPDNRHIVYDGGNFMANWAYFSVPGPTHFTHSLDSGSVGLGLGTAIGVARGQPDRTVVVMIGDGGMLMSMGEIETIIREDLPMIVVVMNDAADGAEVHILRGQNMPVAKAEFFDVDFAPMAEPLGFDCHTVRSVDDLKKLAPLLAKPDGPIVIDCKINGEVIAPFITEFIHKDTGPKH